MTYYDYLDKSDEVDVNDWTYEEIQDFTNLIIKEIQAGHPICSFAIELLSENIFYFEDVFDEECDKGWNYYKRIFKIEDEYYAASILKHYEGEIECDDQILEPVELRVVKTKKWVNKQEPIEKEQVFLLEYFNRDLNCDMFENMFTSFNKVIKYILDLADYQVQDAIKYGSNIEDITKAITLRENIRKYYANLKEDDFEQSYFAQDFTITKTYLI